MQMTPGSNRNVFHACMKKHIDLTRKTPKRSHFFKKMCGFEVF